MNKKNEKIRKQWEKGNRDIPSIARKLGYSGNAITAGVERVREGLITMGLIEK